MASGIGLRYNSVTRSLSFILSGNFCTSMKHINPLQHPRRSKDPAVSYDETGVTSWICQCRVMECQTPILPTGGRERATTWLSMKNRYSTKTCMLKVPISFRCPSSAIANSRMVVPEAKATISVSKELDEELGARF